MTLRPAGDLHREDVDHQFGGLQDREELGGQTN
jgi:hypothetical protein